MYLNRITLIGFLGSDAEKKVSNTTGVLARHQNVLEE
jgi:hypothetical protein